MREQRFLPAGRDRPLSPITAAFAYRAYASYDLIRRSRTLSTESRWVMIHRSTTRETIDFQTARRAGSREDEERAGRTDNTRRGEGARRGPKTRRESAITGMRYVKYARSARYRSFSIESRRASRNVGASLIPAHSLRSRADARASALQRSSAHHVRLA
jgi:hypothetical protein